GLAADGDQLEDDVEAEVALGVLEGVDPAHPGAVEAVEQQVRAGGVEAGQRPVLPGDEDDRLAGGVEHPAGVEQLTVFQPLQPGPIRGGAVGGPRHGRARTAEPLGQAQHGTSGKGCRRVAPAVGRMVRPRGLGAGAVGASSTQAPSGVEPHGKNRSSEMSKGGPAGAADLVLARLFGQADRTGAASSELAAPVLSGSPHGRAAGRRPRRAAGYGDFGGGGALSRDSRSYSSPSRIVIVFDSSAPELETTRSVCGPTPPARTVQVTGLVRLA